MTTHRRHAESIDRRTMLELSGAAMGLAGLGACAREPLEKILPYTVPPPEVVPGIARYYATSMVLDGFASGLLVESHEGRPTKVEGNPEHPASLGATSAHEQASVLGLYDPARARSVRCKTRPATWDTFVAQFGALRSDGGAGLRFILEPTSSPLIGALLEQVSTRYPAARFTFHAPTWTDNAVEGARIAFGRRLQPQYDLREAAVVLSLDADLLASGPFHVRYARDFAERRRLDAPSSAMNRLYVVESMPTPTGTMADHRLQRRPSEVARFCAALAAELAVGMGLAAPGMTSASGVLRRFHTPGDPLIGAVARDLQRAAGASLVVAGNRQPPVVHALAYLMNAALENHRVTRMTAPVAIDAGVATQDLGALARELASGQVDTLVVLEANPSYTAPADYELARLIAGVPNSVCLSQHEHETGRDCVWLVAAAHYLEAWGDARAYDGTVSMVQPLIRPLHGGRTVSEILAVFAGERFPDAYRLLRDFWAARHPAPDFPGVWDETLRRGLMPSTEARAVVATLQENELLHAIEAIPASPGAADPPLELSFLPSPSIHDGRFANNAWLLELPHPITKLTWGNAAMLGPGTAARLGIDDGEVLELTLESRSMRAPALVVPGHADGVVSIELGWGRAGAEQLASGVGANAFGLRTSVAPFFAPGLTVKRLPVPKAALARTQQAFGEHDRHLALVTTLARYRQDASFAARQKGPQLSLYRPVDATGEQWAMTIDTSICSGCSACVIACQAENNVPVVGEEGVLRGREMHWLRIDTYLAGPPEAPSVVHQPMLCQHCEHAPCEYVCPVNATVHSPDGLNEMVYNRCVGTRFCSNNCPYKVRRFNWFDWGEEQPANRGPSNLQKNPDVTVRERGVMEKCTYCVQRIRRAEIAARIAGRELGEGEVVTACQQACPTRAIQFGSLRHETSEMVRWRRQPRSYAVLHELGTSPRTMYLARIDNPNTELG